MFRDKLSDWVASERRDVKRSFSSFLKKLEPWERDYFIKNPTLVQALLSWPRGKEDKFDSMKVMMTKHILGIYDE